MTIQFTQSQIRTAMIEETQIDPMLIYCQFTGAPIGQLSEAEFALMLAALPDDSDIESIVDDLYTRTLASCRPSPAWSYLTPDSLDRLRRAEPLRVCSFLLGKFYVSRDRAYTPIYRNLSDRLADGGNRIIAYRRLTEASVIGTLDEINQLTSLLLMIDSSFDLAKIPSEHLRLPAQVGALTLTNPTALADLIARLSEDYHRLCHLRDTPRDRRSSVPTESQLRRQSGAALVRKATIGAILAVRPAGTSAKAKREARLDSLVDMLNDLLAVDDQPKNEASPATTNPAEPALTRIKAFRFQPRSTAVGED